MLAPRSAGSLYSDSSYLPASSAITTAAHIVRPSSDDRSVAAHRKSAPRPPSPQISSVERREFPSQRHHKTLYSSPVNKGQVQLCDLAAARRSARSLIASGVHVVSHWAAVNQQEIAISKSLAISLSLCTPLVIFFPKSSRTKAATARSLRALGVASIHTTRHSDATALKQKRQFHACGS